MAKAKNSNLHQAKMAKNDEFYTQLRDVENELKHYKEHFKDKIVLCNCDDPTWSAFWKYFHLKFGDLKLKKLISTHFDKTESTYKMEYTGGRDEDIEAGVKTPLKGNGDFRSAECLELLDEADIVVTNPPFSLFREYVASLVEHDKKFVIVGNMNAITYKEIFPLIRDDKLWVGANEKGGTRKGNSLCFIVPSDYTGRTIDVDGVRMAQTSSWWFTNLDFAKRHEKYIFWKRYTPEEFPKYDNYDAINCDKSSDFPDDYYGVVGVPISFLNGFYNPDEFEIVAFRKGEDGKDLVFTREREREFNRTFMSLYDGEGWFDNRCKADDVQRWEESLCKSGDKETEPIDVFCPISSNRIGEEWINIYRSQGGTGHLTANMDSLVYTQNGKAFSVYKRILIQRKETKYED